jgi:hypothetical protein
MRDGTPKVAKKAACWHHAAGRPILAEIADGVEDLRH